ncbi:MAG TPA: FGGY family carbohydrate kinase [Streptosporangiaceae bacterium]|nr:FGGY family carbohydrate kinase [Streptosporangiaceae bacterium]
MTSHPAGRQPTTGVRPASEPDPAGDGYLLALDAGTGSCRAVLFDLAGRQLAVAQREWSHPAAPGIAGSQDFDTAGNWALICACIREILGSVADPGAVLAVGCSSMGGGLVLYDRAGAELWACANGDARARRQAEELLAGGMARDLYRLGGGWISLSAPPRLAWVRQCQPALWDACARLSMIADWMVYRLTETLVTEPSIGSTSGMFDVGARTWSAPIMDLCGLRPALFPEVVGAGTAVGTVTPEASGQTGLATTTRVVPGGVDTALALAGSRLDSQRYMRGGLAVTGGSFWKQTVVSTTAAVEPAGRLRTICHVLPGQWLVEGIGFYAGYALRWLRDHAGPQPRRCRAPGDPDGYAALDQLASAVPPGAHGLLAELARVDAWTLARWHPPFRSRRPGPEPRAGLGVRARAIEEAAAYSARRSAEILTELLGVRLDEVILTGGAARSTLWPQILADVLGLAVRVPAITESAAAGAAAVAGLAVGVLPAGADNASPALPAAHVAEPTAADMPGPAALPPAAAANLPPRPAPVAGPGADAASPSSPTAWVAEPTPAGRQRYDELYDQWRTAYDRPGLASDERNRR